MKAMGQRTWKIGSPLELLDLPDPEPKPREVRVKVAAIGVNPVDWKMRQGGVLRIGYRLIGPPLPFVPGVDFAGTVDQVGARVTELQIGDRVVGGTDFSRGQRGSYAELVTARPDQLCKLPDAVGFEEAGAMPVAGVTAWMTLMEIGGLGTRHPAGASVLVLGAAGGVGQIVVQLARRAGAKVVAVCSGRNRAHVESLGAAVVLDYNEGDPLVAAQAHAPFAIVVDCVGSYAAAPCRKLLGRRGKHIMVAGDQVGAFLQTLVPPFSSKIMLGRSTTPRLSAVAAAMAEGQLKISIAARYPLAEAEAAHEQSRSARTNGKIILLP